MNSYDAVVTNNKKNLDAFITKTNEHLKSSGFSIKFIDNETIEVLCGSMSVDIIPTKWISRFGYLYYGKLSEEVLDVINKYSVNLSSRLAKEMDFTGGSPILTIHQIEEDLKELLGDVYTVQTRGNYSIVVKDRNETILEWFMDIPTCSTWDAGKDVAKILERLNLEFQGNKRECERRVKFYDGKLKELSEKSKALVSKYSIYG
jgi:organic radical activating enzyme